MAEFLAQTLNSRQLLSLLYICECKRKNAPLSVESFKSSRPAHWDEFLSIFSERFANLSETLRFEVLEAHLMSVEDVDIYNDETLEGIIAENKPVLDYLTLQLTQDSRFTLENR